MDRNFAFVDVWDRSMFGDFHCWDPDEEECLRQFKEVEPIGWRARWTYLLLTVCLGMIVALVSALLVLGIGGLLSWLIARLSGETNDDKSGISPRYSEQLKLGDDALKSSRLVLGGALTLVLAALGSFVTSSSAAYGVGATLIRWAVLAWLAGLVLAALSASCCMVSRLAHRKDRLRREEEFEASETVEQNRRATAVWGIRLWALSVASFTASAIIAWQSL